MRDREFHWAPLHFKLAILPLGSMKRVFVAVLSAVSFASLGNASSFVVNGGNFVSINSQDPSNPFAGLYNLAPNQGEIDPLMTFDLSAFGNDIDSNGSLTITDANLCCSMSPENFLTTSLSLYALTAPYNASTANWNSVTAAGYPTGAPLDTEPYNISGYTSQTPVTFTIPEAILQAWATSPSTNYGVIVIESNSWSGDQGHSDIPYISSGLGSPTLTLDATPEPSSLALIFAGFAGLGLLLRRKSAASI